MLQYRLGGSELSRQSAARLLHVHPLAACLAASAMLWLLMRSVSAQFGKMSVSNNVVENHSVSQNYVCTLKRKKKNLHNIQCIVITI